MVNQNILYNLYPLHLLEHIQINIINNHIKEYNNFIKHYDLNYYYLTILNYKKTYHFHIMELLIFHIFHLYSKDIHFYKAYILHYFIILINMPYSMDHFHLIHNDPNQ